MLHKLLILAVVALLASPVHAGDLQRTLRDHWVGAWVVLDVETYSNCDGWYTNNRVNGDLSRGRGRFRFQRGELAKVYGLDLKRSRLDLLLKMPEPRLLSYQDGPFTLYRRAECRVELQYEIPRTRVRRGDLAAIDRGLSGVLERYASEEFALDSPAWNGRRCQAFPDDYEITLARHAVWKAERHNASVDAKLDEANELTLRLADRISSDPDYLAGFAQGVEAAKSADVRKCSQLMAASLSSAKPKTEDEAEARKHRGSADGRHLVLGLEMLRSLPRCYVEVPEVDGVAAAEVIRKTTDEHFATAD